MLGTSTLISTTADGAHDGGGEAAQPSTTTNNTTSIMIGGGGGGVEDEKAMSQSGGGTGSGGDLFESDRSTGGNRWPRQETLALLKIRSDMDVIFRDSSLKGPLWEEVSRKMAELGYHRSAKKCKEKFENVYKYHKRTKDGRVGKSDGKTYRFFEQLEALEQHHMAMAAAAAASQGIPSLPHSSPPHQVPPRVVSQSQSQGPAQAAVPVTMVIPAGTNPTSVTVPSSPHPISVVHTTCSISATHPQQHQVQPQQVNHNNPMTQVSQQQQQHYQPQQQQHQAMGSIPTHSSIQMENPSSPSATQSSSSSTSSDEELLGRSRKRKRKWKDFFEKLMKEVIDKQEELQKRFLEAVEKREHDRVAREEAWKMQEVSRLNREHEILVQERSMAAAKDAALISFLQKLSDQQQIPSPLPAQVQAQAQGQGQARAATPVVVPASAATTTTQPQPTPQQPPQVQQVVLQPQPQPQLQPQTKPQVNVTETPVTLPSPTPTQPLTTQLPQPQQQTPQPVSQALVVSNTNNGDHGDFQKSNSNNNGDNLLQASSSRWPKAEVQALINLRTNLDQKYQENGPKGPLWEEISSAMKKLGYNRNAKRCKEKWENINKYFKKVKESNKKRPEDSKTCPYFHQLDALYRERSKMEINNPNANAATIVATYGQPQQQQMKQDGTTMEPIMAQPEQQWPHPNQGMDDQGSENNQDDSDDEGDEEDDDDQGSGYEIVANNNSNNSNNNNNSNVNAGSMSTTTAATRTATAE